MLQTLEMSSCFAFQSTAINITQAHATPFHKKRGTINRLLRLLLQGTSASKQTNHQANVEQRMKYSSVWVCSSNQKQIQTFFL